MRFILVGVGSLGDVMPQVSLACELSRRGHHALVIGLSPYAGAAAAAGVEYLPVPADTGALWPSSALARRLCLAQPGVMYATMLGRLRTSAPLVNRLLLDVVQPGDVIVTGIVTAGATRLLAREVGARTVPVLLAPLLPAGSAASSALAPPGVGRVGALLGSSVMWRLSEGLAAAHTHDMAQRLGTHRIRPLGSQPSLLATSSTLTPPSDRWPGWLRQTGWITPPIPDHPLGDPLRDFLAAGGPSALMTFGTCPVVSPSRDIEMFTSAARAAGTRVVLQTDALDGGPVSDDVFNAPGIAHAALVPQLTAVIHHGGAGTTYASLAAGRPAMVVPHLGDQAYYGRRVHALGAGPPVVPRWRLTTSTLTGRLRSMVRGDQAEGYARAAATLARALSTEDGRGTAVDALEEISGS